MSIEQRVEQQEEQQKHEHEEDDHRDRDRSGWDHPGFTDGAGI